MSPPPPTLADRIASLHTAAQAEQARIHVPAGLDALLLCLITALFGRMERIARTWHPAPDPTHPTERPIPLHTRLPTDGTHISLACPFLYVLGPGPNRGLTPHARPAPRLRPRSARAPPAPISLRTKDRPETGPRTRALFIMLS